MNGKWTVQMDVSDGETTVEKEFLCDICNILKQSNRIKQKIDRKIKLNDMLVHREQFAN